MRQFEEPLLALARDAIATSERVGAFALIRTVLVLADGSLVRLIAGLEPVEDGDDEGDTTLSGFSPDEEDEQLIDEL